MLQRVAVDEGVANVTQFMAELLQAQKPLPSSQVTVLAAPESIGNMSPQGWRELISEQRGNTG